MRQSHGGGLRLIWTSWAGHAIGFAAEMGG
jgi:hypothetical protein